MLCRSLINRLNYRLFAVILFCLGWLSDAVADNSKYVILITIDGMHAGMVTDPEMPSPYLKMMKREGLFVDKVKGVPPTATYPSHTSIVTGALLFIIVSFIILRLSSIKILW